MWQSPRLQDCIYGSFLHWLNLARARVRLCLAVIYQLALLLVGGIWPICVHTHTCLRGPQRK